MHFYMAISAITAGFFLVLVCFIATRSGKKSCQPLAGFRGTLQFTNNPDRKSEVLQRFSALLHRQLTMQGMELVTFDQYLLELDAVADVVICITYSEDLGKILGRKKSHPWEYLASISFYKGPWAREVLAHGEVELMNGEDDAVVAFKINKALSPLIKALKRLKPLPQQALSNDSDVVVATWPR